MPIKISANQSAVAHHIIDGAYTFPYAIDAHSAVQRFPKEWSHQPWPLDKSNAALKESGKPEIEVTPEEQAAIDEHAKAVAEAGERLKAFHERKAAEKAEAEQVEADEALVKSMPPRPEVRLTPAQIRKRAAETDDERIVREKAEQDRIENSRAIMTG